MINSCVGLSFCWLIIRTLAFSLLQNIIIVVKDKLSCSLSTSSVHPANKIKAQLISKLRRIKKDSNLDEGTYKAMYPTGCVPP